MVRWKGFGRDFPRGKSLRRLKRSFCAQPGEKPATGRFFSRRAPFRVRIPGKSGEKQKNPQAFQPAGSDGALEGIRTPDLLIRSQTLYPTELPAHLVCNRLVRCKKYIIRFPFDCQRFFQIFLNFFLQVPICPFFGRSVTDQKACSSRSKNKVPGLSRRAFSGFLGHAPLEKG